MGSVFLHTFIRQSQSGSWAVYLASFPLASFPGQRQLLCRVPVILTGGGLPVGALESDVGSVQWRRLEESEGEDTGLCIGNIGSVVVWGQLQSNIGGCFLDIKMGMTIPFLSHISKYRLVGHL